LFNLWLNAIKFAEKGARVTTDCRQGDSTIDIFIQDTGPGVPSDRLETIFDRFVQVDSSLTRRSEGTRLGLAISRDLARAMSEDITVKAHRA
jgi:signal transduction histidine kinase